jgi:hypothetical protein
MNQKDPTTNLIKLIKASRINAINPITPSQHPQKKGHPSG